MPNFSGGAHCAFAPTARQALLNGHRGRDAIHRIHLRTSRRLHDAAGIGVETFQIAALSFVEQNIKRQGGFARTADTCDHIELTAWNIHTQTLQIVFFGMDDANMVAHLGACNRDIGRHLLGHLVHLPHAEFVIAQRLACVGSGVFTQGFGRALGHQQTAALAAFGP